MKPFVKTINNEFISIDHISKIFLKKTNGDDACICVDGQFNHPLPELFRGTVSECEGWLKEFEEGSAIKTFHDLMRLADYENKRSFK